MGALDHRRREQQAVALHTITDLPLDPHHPLLRHYSAMKLGVRESVQFYARLLIPLIEETLSATGSETDWVLTAPPLYVIPSAANLLAWEIGRILGQQDRSPSPRVVDLRYSRPAPQRSRASLAGGEYSKSGIADRIRNRQELHEGDWAPRPAPADFRGRQVLVINDINVTGTQQRFLGQTLSALHPKSIHFLYVIQVDPHLGQSNPEVEYSLNQLNLETFDDFAEIVARTDIDYTSRCVARLFEYPGEVLAGLFRAFDESRRSRLHDLLQQEGIFTSGEYEAKLALLR